LRQVGEILLVSLVVSETLVELNPPSADRNVRLKLRRVIDLRGGAVSDPLTP
jgi:hypothetical protein